MSSVRNNPGVFSYLLDGLKIRDEEVGVVVGHFVLEDGDEALQTHPSVDALLRQRLQLRLRLSANRNDFNDSNRLKTRKV